MAKQQKAAPVPHPWSHGALLAKAQRYAEIMVDHAKDEWRFALWSSLTLELLLRAALARVSPVLLAESRNNWNHLYFALGNTPRVARYVPRSVSIAEVVNRLELILDSFTAELKAFCIKHLETRNEELHTGNGAFDASGTDWHGVRLFFVGGPWGFCERHGKSYLIRRRRGEEGGGGGSLTGGAIPSVYRWAWFRWYSRAS